VTRRAAAALAIALAAWLGAPAPVVGQSGERKPPPAAKEETRKDDRAGQARAAKPDARDRKRSEERIRLDAPVAFPVDI
jgi:hypothetical protein